MVALWCSSGPLFLIKKLRICFWLHWVSCCAWAFSGLQRMGAPLCCSAWSSHMVSALVVERGLWARGLRCVACRLQSSGPGVMMHGPSCSMTCGIFLGQGSNPCPLHCQVILIHCVTREAPGPLFLY